MAVTIRRLGDSRDLLGESPCWDERTGALCWVDSFGGVLRRRVGDGLTAHALPAPIGSIAPCESGAFVVALKDRFARFDLASGALATLAAMDVQHPDVRLNDGKCDPWGHFIAGTLQTGLAAGEVAQGGLYRLRAGGALEVLARGFALTNGPCFSADGHTFYVADSPTRTIWAYDYSPDGPLANRRVFVQTERFASGPDGATVDAHGHLWTALPRAGKLARFAPDGTLDRLVDLPMSYPTSLCFGGPGLSTAYVTSISRSTHLTGERPDDGGIFELSGLPGPGLPVARYRDA